MPFTCSRGLSRKIQVDVYSYMWFYSDDLFSCISEVTTVEVEHRYPFGSHMTSVSRPGVHIKVPGGWYCQRSCVASVSS